MNFTNAVVVFGLILALSGCTTASQKPAADGEENRSQEKAQTVALPRGASSQAVRDALGAPLMIEPVKGNPAAALWTYRRPVARKVNTVEASMESVLVFDPTNRQTGMTSVRIPIQHMQEVVIEEVLVLIMEYDQLKDWRWSHREISSGPTVR